MPNDIFISYAHRDDKDPSGPGIVTRLESYLLSLAAQKVGRDLDIFRDASMGSGEFWEPKLMDSAKTARIFMPVISESWIMSGPSQAEWRAFWNAKVGEQSAARIPVIPITFELDDPWSKLPPEVGRIQVRHHLQNGMSEDAFRKVALAVAAEVADFLKVVKVKVEPQEETAAPKRRVFLGLAFSATMKEWRRTVEAQLRSKEFDVADVVPAAGMEAAEFLAEVGKTVQTCIAAVNLIDGRSGGYLEGDRQRSVIELQCTASSLPDVRNYLWTGPDLNPSEVADDAYRRFLESATYTKQSVTEFKNTLITELTKPKKAPPGPAPHRPVVCLICESGDDIVDDVRSFFAQTKGWPVTVPDRQVVQKLMSESYDATFRNNEHFLFYWGKGTKEWCTLNYESLLNARREEGGRVREPRAIAIYLAEELSDEKKRFAWPWPTIRRFDRFDGRALSDFIRDVDQSLAS